MIEIFDDKNEKAKISPDKLTPIASNLGDCNFIRLKEHSIAAFIDADIFEIRIQLESGAADYVMIYFWKVMEGLYSNRLKSKSIQDRAH